MHQHAAAQSPELSVRVKPLVMDCNRRQVLVPAVRLACDRRRLFLARLTSDERDGVAPDELRGLGEGASPLHLAPRLRLLRRALRTPASGQGDREERCTGQKAESAREPNVTRTHEETVAAPQTSGQAHLSAAEMRR